MDSAQYKIRKEAAWAVLNTCAGGTPEHIRYIKQSVLQSSYSLFLRQIPKLNHVPVQYT